MLHFYHRGLFYSVTHFYQYLKFRCPLNCRPSMEILRNFYGNSLTLRPNFFIGWQEGYPSIISFNLINIRQNLGVLFILAIFKIIWAAKDLLRPCGSIFCIRGWEGVPKSYLSKKIRNTRILK